MKHLLAILAAWALLPTVTLAADYYVATTGNDTNPGTLTAPFHTIGKAASLMKPGDRCLVRSGIYRETVTPSADDLYFGPFQDERVEISGCEVVAGPWDTYAGQIQKASVASKVMQVFVQGQRMNLARYPAQTPEEDMLSYANWVETTTSSPSLGVGNVVFADMPNVPVNYWVGGYYSGRNGGNPFTAARGNIIASNDKTLTIDHLPVQWRHKLHAVCAVGKGCGYIINCLHALTIPSQWYWGDGQLYFYPPAGTAPAQSTVEARTRLWGFDMSGRANIVVEKIAFQAASLLLDNSTHCEVRDCSVMFPAPWSDYDMNEGCDYGGKEDGSCGVFVSGSNNRILRCQIAHSWGGGVRLDGNDNTVEECRIDDIDWSGRRISPVQVVGLRNHVLKNTISRSAQSGIDGGNRTLGFGKVGCEADIRFNLVMDVGLLTTDTGLFYMNNQSGPNPVHALIAYNTFLRNHATLSSNGIYIDNGTFGVTIHHNVIDGGPTCIMGGVYLHKSELHSGTYSDIFVYNNTIVHANQSIGYHGTKKTVLNDDNIVFRNNLCDHPIAGATKESDHNIINTGLSEFVNAGGDDFHLVPSSPAIDAGTVIPGITDGYTGKAPDCGAYEFSAKTDYPPVPSLPKNGNAPLH